MASKRQIEQLERARKLLEKIFEDDDLYEEALNSGAQPDTATLALGDVIRFLESITK
jgi:hypothetical protein